MKLDWLRIGLYAILIFLAFPLALALTSHWGFIPKQIAGAELISDRLPKQIYVWPGKSELQMQEAAKDSDNQVEFYSGLLKCEAVDNHQPLDIYSPLPFCFRGEQYVQFWPVAEYEIQQLELAAHSLGQQVVFMKIASAGSDGLSCGTEQNLSASCYMSFRRLADQQADKRGSLLKRLHDEDRKAGY